MENPEVTLSLCIPTYNRADYLDRCLKSIVKQVGNLPEVEILISDNVSNDNTQAIGEAYALQYDNVKYCRNETNIGGDQNFIRLFSIAQGKYIKLLNDYIEMADGGALKILEIVKGHLENKEVLFFPNGVSYLKKKDYHYSTGLNQFLRIASFWSTWIGAIGLWRDDFHRVMEQHTFKTQSFLQAELLFESVLIKKKAVTYSRQVMTAHEVVDKKTMYNFFELFINSYLNTLILGLRREKKISWMAYYREKNTFFTDFLFFWYKNVKIKQNHSTDISAKGVGKLVFATYKFDPVFYLYLLFLPLYLLGFYFKKFKRRVGGK